MKVALFEVCRRPEVPKANTEAQVLSTCFTRIGIDFTLHSNDGMWAHHAAVSPCVDRHALRACLDDRQVTVAHFAMHGTEAGLVLQWTGPLHDRVEADALSGLELRAMTQLRGKLVVSGACGSAHLAADVLAAGATAYVAPDRPIPWKNLGVLFESFYALMSRGASPTRAMAAAVDGHPELASYRVYVR